MKRYIQYSVGVLCAALFLAALGYIAMFDLQARKFLSSSSVATACTIAFVGPLLVRAAGVALLLSGNKFGGTLDSFKCVLPALSLLYSIVFIIVSPTFEYRQLGYIFLPALLVTLMAPIPQLRPIQLAFSERR